VTFLSLSFLFSSIFITNIKFPIQQMLQHAPQRKYRTESGLLSSPLQHHLFSSSFFLPFSIAMLAPARQPRVYGVAKQENAQIKCIVDANPPEVDFKWTFNNSAESIDVAASHVSRHGEWKIQPNPAPRDSNYAFNGEFNSICRSSAMVQSSLSPSLASRLISEEKANKRSERARGASKVEYL
jgi:hypothetical protein